ncbi:MAG TPA: hypothetical protein VGQ49_20760 [Bryobacteraceae bacterium]|jgi:hypothetical protein|nr:hypothetical protein [Bryobacteraceae bacterium]
MRYQILIIAGLLIAPSGLFAQGRGGRGGGAAQPQNAKAAAPFDLTGYWVSVVTEDWRYRMVTPSLGDYQGVPMTPEAIKIANAWDPEKEQASGDVCKSYGAPALLRAPGRIHITWLDDDTMKLEMDAGKQTRLFHFGSWKAPAGPPTLQGDSTAAWVRGGGRGATDGSLTVTTSNLKGGFLRKNGVPYSDKTSLLEYFDLIKEPDGTPLIVVTVSTTDPTYLRQPFVITSQFKKESSDAGWKPSECSAKW